MMRLLAILLLPLSAFGAPFSLLQSGDWHINGNQPQANYSNFMVMRDFVLTHTNDGTFNIKILASPGDCYEQQIASEGPTNLVTDLTAMRNAGIFPFPCGGNHDADETNVNGSSGSAVPMSNAGMGWNNWFPVSWYQSATNIPGIGYAGVRDAGDSKHIAMTYTNQGIKFLFLTIPWATNLAIAADGVSHPDLIKAAYLPSVQWATNKLGQYPDHLGIVLTHYPGISVFGSSIGLQYWDVGGVTYSNIGPAQALFDDGLNTCSNLFLILGGHNRGLLHGNLFFRNAAGNWGCINQWNTQSWTNGATFDSLITFVPETQTAFFRAYDINSGTWLTNGQITYQSGISPRTNNHAWQMQIPDATRRGPIRAIKLITP